MIFHHLCSIGTEIVSELCCVKEDYLGIFVSLLAQTNYRACTRALVLQLFPIGMMLCGGLLQVSTLQPLLEIVMGYTDVVEFSRVELSKETQPLLACYVTFVVG